MQTAEVCRKHGISPATFYQWKATSGGLEVSGARRLRPLEAENVRLKKLLAEAMLDKAVLKDVASKSGNARSMEERCDRDARRARDQRAAGMLTPRRGPAARSAIDHACRLTTLMGPAAEQDASKNLRGERSG